jgi:hypothetical protein
MDSASAHAGAPRVGEHLRHFVELAKSDRQGISWRSVGDVVSESNCVA